MWLRTWPNSSFPQRDKPSGMFRKSDRVRQDLVTKCGGQSGSAAPLGSAAATFVELNWLQVVCWKISSTTGLAHRASRASSALRSPDRYIAVYWPRRSHGPQNEQIRGTRRLLKHNKSWCQPVPTSTSSQRASAANVLVLTVRCKIINFAYQIFPLFIPEMSAGSTSYIVQVIHIYFIWIL
jgi:hypothetical protein